MCVLRECEGARVMAMLVWGPADVWLRCVRRGGTRGSGVLSSADDVLEMSVVRGVGGVCDMYMCLARGRVGGVGGEWMRGLGLGFTNPGGTGGKWDMCLCFGCGGVGGVGGERLGPRSRRVGWC